MRVGSSSTRRHVDSASLILVSYLRVSIVAHIEERSKQRIWEGCWTYVSHSGWLVVLVVFLQCFLGEYRITFSHLDKMSLLSTWICIAAETYSVVEHLNLVRAKKCLHTLNDRFKVFTDALRIIEISVGSCLVHFKDSEPVFLDRELVLAPSHTTYLDTLSFFHAVIGCRDSAVRDIFELVRFLMLVQIVSGEEKHGRLDFGHCAAM